MTVDPEDIPTLRQEFQAVIERAPLDVRKRIPTFGLEGDEFELMRKVKMAFDPECRLNPGRHVDGERAR
jgi:FAD/FMN-containing dehydrogenase